MNWFILIVLSFIDETKCETCSFDKKQVSMQRPMLYLSCRIESSFTELLRNYSTTRSKYGRFFIVPQIYFYLARPNVVDKNLLLEDYLESLIRDNLTTIEFDFKRGPTLSIQLISFTNIKGIDIDHSYTHLGRAGSQDQLTIEYDYSHFVPFSNGLSLVNKCDMRDFESDYLLNLASLELSELVFQTSTRYYRHVCSVFFRNAQIQTLELKGIGSSFLGDNSLTFDYFTENGTNAGLNASIRNLVLNLYLDRIDSGILNDQVLENILSVEIYGKLNKIEPCIFESYNRIFLRLVNLQTFFHSGIEWCKSNKLSRLDFFFKIQNHHLNGKKELSNIKMHYTFPIEDICVFKNLLSHEKHYFIFRDNTKSKECSCSIFLLVRNYIQNPSQELINELNFETNMFSICTENKTYDEWMEECDFDSRFAKCDLNQSTRAEAEWTAFDTAFLVAGLKYAVAVVLLPMMCVIGLVTSCLSVAVLRKMIAKLAEKRHDDTSKRSRLMYSYLLQHAVGSAAVCALFAFKPLTDCVMFGGIFCSPVYTSWHTRLFEAIGLNLLGTALKLHTTTTALLFSLARLTINVKNKKRRSIRIFSKMRPVHVSLGCFLVSLLLSSVKLFTSNDYSVLSWKGDIFISFKIPTFSTFQIYYSNFITSEAFYYLNLSLELTLDLVIPLLTVLIDLVLLKVMRQQNANRSKMSKQLQTKSEENEKQFTKMIIFNGVFNFIFRIPVLTSNILEFIVFNQFGFYFYNFQSCQFDDYPLLSLCPSILSISNMLLQLGFIIDFSLLLRFNKDFRAILKENSIVRFLISKRRDVESPTK
nr:G protein-coupled receptor [Proales similis]